MSSTIINSIENLRFDLQRRSDETVEQYDLRLSHELGVTLRALAQSAKINPDSNETGRLQNLMSRSLDAIVPGSRIVISVKTDL